MRKKAPNNLLYVKKTRQSNNQGKNNNTLRIIGGDWRSRKLPFVDAPGLRPTPDRIRETLFNWLQGNVHGASCIDMFAGSGALAFEALSRGASDVVFVEKNAVCANQLKENIALLKTEAKVVQCDALNLLKLIEKPVKPFDLVFLDPPYRLGLIPKSLSYLLDEKLIDNNSFIYLEHEAEESFDWGDFGLEVLKEAKAGQVYCFLLQQTK